jgi:hypothetical protein
MMMEYGGSEYYANILIGTIYYKVKVGIMLICVSAVHL